VTAEDRPTPRPAVDVDSPDYCGGYRKGYADGARDAAMLWEDVRAAILSREGMTDPAVEAAGLDRAPVLAFAAERMEQARTGLLMLLALVIVLAAAPNRRRPEVTL
jgi:hypothetical protein